MNRTYDDIMIELRKAARGPLGRRTLAGMVRKSIDVLSELRADHTWDELSAAMAEVGYDVSGETLRRTVRRALQANPPPADTQSNEAPSAALTWAQLPAVDTGPSPHSMTPGAKARDPPPRRAHEAPLPVNSTTLRLGGDLLDNLNKLMDLNQ